MRELSRFAVPRGARPDEVLAAAADLDGQLEVEDGWISVTFNREPPAGVVADVLDSVDRESRRAATALSRASSPRELYGRGARLLPRRRGLAVREARPGSLDLVLLLAGIFHVVVSQPVSFALNLANLLQYSHLLARAVLPNGRTEEGELEVPRLPAERAGSQMVSPPGAAVISTPHGPIVVPRNASLRLSLRAADGTELEVDYRSD